MVSEADYKAGDTYAAVYNLAITSELDRATFSVTHNVTNYVFALLIMLLCGIASFYGY